MPEYPHSGAFIVLIMSTDGRRHSQLEGPLGEGGAIGSPPAVFNAVADALRPFGVKLDRSPLGPSELLEAIEVAGRR